MQELTGRVAVVTGAASGIGLAMAERFSAEGMQVVLADVERAALDQAAAALGASGAEVLAVPTDVSDAEQVEELAARAHDTFGAVHVLCNNAGVFSGTRPLWEQSVADYRWVLGVNLWGVVHGVRAFVPRMLERGGEGHIVNTASLAGLLAGPLMGPYVPSKFAVVGLSEQLQRELELLGSSLKVSVLCPGFVRTRIADAERNRPEALGGDDAPQEEGMREMFNQLIATGMPPAQVAGTVVDAIRAERFYILTHPELNAPVVTRGQEIVAGSLGGFPTPD